MWPACRLPMVGTKATRSPAARHCSTRARTASTVVTVSIAPAGSKAVFRRRILAGFDGLHVARDRGLWRIAAGHEIAHETRFSARSDIQNIVQHQYLAVGVGPGADADHRHLESLGNAAAERGRNALQQHQIRARRFERQRVLEHAAGGLVVAPLDAKTAGLVDRLRL